MHILVHSILTHYTLVSNWSTTDKVFLWLHWWQQRWSTFDVLIKELPQYTHINMDLPWFGDSWLPPHDWGVKEYAAYVQEFIQKLWIASEKLIIIGHSFWWRIAIELLWNNMIEAKSLVLMWSAGIQKSIKNSTYFGIISRVKKISIRLHMTTCYERIAKMFRSADYNTSWLLQGNFLKTVNYDQTSLLANIHTPTLLIRWIHDDQTPLSDAHIMVEKIQWSKLYTTDGGHFTYKTHSQDIVCRITSFLEHHE